MTDRVCARPHAVGDSDDVRVRLTEEKKARHCLPSLTPIASGVQVVEPSAARLFASIPPQHLQALYQQLYASDPSARAKKERQFTS